MPSLLHRLSVRRFAGVAIACLFTACGGGDEAKSSMADLAGKDAPPIAPGTPNPHGQLDPHAVVPLTAEERALMEQAHAKPERKVAFAGAVRLTGELGARTTGYVYTYVRGTGTRIPLLIRKWQIGQEGFRRDGDDWVLDFTLHDDDTMMAGMTVELPTDIELKIEFDPDGLVDTKEGGEAVVLPAVVGTTDIDVSLRVGMDKPSEAKPQYPKVFGESEEGAGEDGR